MGSGLTACGGKGRPDFDNSMESGSWDTFWFKERFLETLRATKGQSGVNDMPTAEIKESVPAAAAKVFELIHDYRLRLEWDTLLSEAYLEPEFQRAERGAISVCRGKLIVGGFSVRTEYVSFEPGKVAAVRMLNKPPFFDTFAASIRHTRIDDENSEVIYKVNFTARPRWLRPVLDPIMRRVFIWETRKRLRALKSFFQRQKADQL